MEKFVYRHETKEETFGGRPSAASNRGSSSHWYRKSKEKPRERTQRGSQLPGITQGPISSESLEFEEGN